MLPNFLVVGAAKAGTTSLYNYLKQHPQIFMSPEKEINYFVSKYIPTQHKRALTVKEYKSFFSGVKNEKAIGESSPSYLWVTQAPNEIRKLLPNCKIIIILRNPVERLISDYYYTQLQGYNLIPLERILEIGRNEISYLWHSPYAMIQKSLYYNQVKKYLNIFGQDNVKIFRFESLKNDSLQVLKDTTAFLEVNSNFTYQVKKIHNQGAKPQNYILLKIVYNRNLKKVAKCLIPRKARKLVKSNIINFMKAKSAEIDINTKRFLYYSFFKDDVHRLQDLLNMDLSNWCT